MGIPETLRGGVLYKWAESLYTEAAPRLFGRLPYFAAVIKISTRAPRGSAATA